MITNYFSLQALTAEMNTVIHGGRIYEVFSQRKNELLISIENPSATSETKSDLTLCVSVEPKLNYIYLRDRVMRARKNSVDLFDDVVQHSVESIGIHQSDRLIVVTLENGKKMLFQIYNTVASNILLVDENYVIAEAFKNNDILKGTIFKIEEHGPGIDYVENAESFINKVLQQQNVTIYNALKRTLPLLGPVFCREILFRSETPEETITEAAGENQMLRIHKEIQNLYYQTSHPEPRIYFLQDHQEIFSILPIDHLRNKTEKTCATVNEGIKKIIIDKFKESKFSGEKDPIVDKAEQELGRLRQTLNKKAPATSSGPEEYELLGKILLANLPLLKKGMKHIELHSPIGESSINRISLDPALTSVQNAERYFDKAKKAKGAREKSAERLKQLTGKLTWLETLVHTLHRCETEEDLKKIIEEHKDKLRSMKLIDEQPGRELPPFRIFTVAGGYEVWVGKSSANNDLLTMKYAKPNDLWFHVRGAGGSHTVLKVKGDAQSVPKEAVRQAAGIAAYYSKMRNAGTVPVAYCERKYVKKPKHLKEGAVLLEREHVVFVKPKLLGNT